MNKPIKEVLCKKYYHYGGCEFFGEFFKNEFSKRFQLEDIHFNPTIIDSEYIYIWNNNRKGGIRFKITKLEENYNLPYFYDYFCNENEIRKFKLKHIKNKTK